MSMIFYILLKKIFQALELEKLDWTLDEVLKPFMDFQSYETMISLLSVLLVLW